jgi:hypothetical protein
MARPAAEMLLVPVRMALALLANLLPRRFRLEWDGRLPITATAGWSALLTVFLAFAIGVPGFLRYATRAGSAVTDTMLETAGKVNQGQASIKKMPESYLLSMLTLPAFLFFTPRGLVTLYVGGTGLFRCLAFAAGESRGDPLIGGVDAGLRVLRTRRRARRDAAAREAQEGPEVPDVLLSGRDGGAPEAVYALVSSRRKPGWSEGAFVLDGETRYRIGRPFDRRYAGRLRTVYPLVEAAQAEVMRRIVRCSLPEPGVSDALLPPGDRKGG